MTAIVWDTAGQRFYELGLDRGVFYPVESYGMAWDGLVSVQERIANRAVLPTYVDGVKVLDVMGNGDFEATLSCVSAPYDFYPMDGGKQIARGVIITQQP